MVVCELNGMNFRYGSDLRVLGNPGANVRVASDMLLPIHESCYPGRTRLL